MFHDDFEQELYVDKFKQIIDLWWFSDWAINSEHSGFNIWFSDWAINSEHSGFNI